MSLTAKVTPSYTWPSASKMTLARLRLTARPIVEIIGKADGAQIADGAITYAHLAAPLQTRFINVKDAPYNATGDGLTNDTPAIMAALAALKAAGGGVLRIPKGKYRLGKTVDGYATGQYEAAQNYALLVDFSDIIIEGEGMGITTLLADTLSTTHLLVSTQNLALQLLANIGVRGITFEHADAAADYAGTATTLSRQGQDPLTATSQIDQGFTLATMLQFTATSGDYMRNIFVTECEFLNPVRHAVALAWVNGARFSNNTFRYYDGFAPPEHSHHATNAGRCGICSGSERVNDITVIGNNFNGNVTGTNYSTYNGSPPGSLYYTYLAADGFVWFAKGGNVLVAGNTIRNYALEACQLNAAPVVCSNNTFFTTVGTPSSVALLAYPDSPNETDIDKRTYIFQSNTVVGGSGGCWMKGNSFSNLLPCPTYRAIINNNILEGVGTPFAAVGAEVFECCNNVSTGAITFFIYNIGPLDVIYPAVDFRCKYFNFVGNTVVGCTDVAYLFNSPMLNEGVILIDGGIVSRGNFHALFADPTAGTTYNVLLGDTVFIDSTGIEGAPVFYDPISADVRFVRHFGRPFHAASSPRTPALGYRKGDVLRNTARSKAGVLFWEAISDVAGGAVFEPVFSAAKGVLASETITALLAATPIELLAPLEGQSVRIFSLSIINATNCTWAGGANTVLRVRTKVSTGTPVVLAQVAISKLIAATTLVAQADIVFTQPVNGTGGFGGDTPVGSGIEVIGWDTVLNTAVNLSTNAVGGDGKVIIAGYCQYEFRTSV